MTLFAPPATADWLVTRSGDPVETEGTWEVKGRLVVFTLAGGGLSSMRLADVDLDASEHLTAASRRRPEANQAPGQRPEQAPEEPPREAVFVLSDNDVGHVDSRLRGSIKQRQRAAAEAREKAKRTAAATEDGLSVVDWSQTFDSGIDGVVITGRLQNRGRGARAGVTLQVVLYRTDGRLAGRAPATVEDTVLKRDEPTSFRATFPGILGFDRPEFRISSTPLAPRAEEEPEATASPSDN